MVFKLMLHGLGVGVDIICCGFLCCMLWELILHGV